MHVKDVIIDGFKSYANRTVISDWDPSFNAITGLNGSGKSNILDAICFVLGISNLSQVRAANLQELVYKQGQSRVTKASVTIVFDNSDKSPTQCPVGYHDFNEITVTRQVVIGGRNKYIINGHVAQLEKVKNLFHSVQLNVNNPHFLIMQGRITKVVNMKPQELLSLLEESAGTRMYENKKKAAQRTIQKKQGKMEEINRVLLEDITPTIERLRSEKSTYMTWSANEQEKKRLLRFVTAAMFCEAEVTVKGSKDEMKAMEDERLALEEQNQEKAELTKTISKDIKKLQQERDEKMQTASSGLEQQVANRAKEMVLHTTNWKNKKEELQAERVSREKLQSSWQDTTDAIAVKKVQKEKATSELQQTEKEYRELEKTVEGLQGSLLGIGMSESKEKEQGTLASQLMDAQKAATDAESEFKAAQIKAKHVQASLEEKKKTSHASERDYQKMKADYDKSKKKLDELESKLQKLNINPAQKEEYKKRVALLEEEISKLKQSRDQLSANISGRMSFDYTSPSRDFDPSSVKGLVAKLVDVKDVKDTLALEVAAGGRLYNVVTDTEQTGKLLMEKGKLKKRITIIPLNKVKAKTVTREMVAKAEAVAGKGNARVALSLVGYAPEVEQAMKYVFGNTFICSDSKTADSVTYDRDIRTRSVTLEGDVVEPSGTVTGGSRNAQQSILLKLRQLNEVRQQLEDKMSEQANVRKQLDAIVKAEEGVQDLTNQKELLTQELSLLKSRMDQSEFAKQNSEYKALETDLEQLSAHTEKSKKDKDAALKRCKELEASIKDFEKERGGKMKQVEKEITEGRKKLATFSKDLKKAQQNLERIALELTELENELRATKEQLDKMDKSVASLDEEAKQAEKEVAKEKQAHDKLVARLDEERKKLDASDKDLAKLNKEKDKIAKDVKENELQLQKLKHKLTRMQTDQESAKKKVESMLQQHDWIATEKQFFDKPGDYDFTKLPPKQAKARLDQLQQENEDLGKKINKKALDMYEKAEQDCQELVRKRDQIEKDKKKIEEVIEELDRKKNEALATTHKKVTADFGSIFSTLLPGTTAKLEPSEGKSVLDGLEMRVALGGVWKDSLSELSGGQKSLLALSLILALLLFKPAPMYILDEIDSALDLSHTQNIGSMLKTHFPQSQFIVVSLKEGMFNNANVVFRTKFVDGVSQVTRTVNQKAKKK